MQREGEKIPTGSVTPDHQSESALAPHLKCLFLPSWVSHLSSESLPTRTAQSWALWPRRHMVRIVGGLPCFCSHSGLNVDNAPGLSTMLCLRVPAGRNMMLSALFQALILTSKWATLAEGHVLKSCSLIPTVRGKTMTTLSTTVTGD